MTLRPEEGVVRDGADVAAPRVVVAAGALLTPGLPARSRVGRAGPLTSQVGRHLRIHPATRVPALFDEPVRAWEGVPQSYQVRDLEPEGVVLQGMWVPPEIQAPVVPGVGWRHKARMAALERMASFGGLVHERGEGRVWPLGRRSLAWYRLRRDDTMRLLRGVALAARIFLAAGAREVHPGVRQRPVLRSEAEARELEGLALRPGDLELMAFHPMGTARMGADPRRAAVDPAGGLRGVAGVWVADASLFPDSSGANPQLTIMALAARIAAGVARGSVRAPSARGAPRSLPAPAPRERPRARRRRAPQRRGSGLRPPAS